MRITDLSSYPLKRMQDRMWDHMNEGFDWKSIYAKVTLEKPAYVDVSGVVRLFPHLQLDENYALYCYLAREFHGIRGTIAAVPKDADPAPTYKPVLEAAKTLGVKVEPPECPIPPLEAMYRDGSTAGCLETILLRNLLCEIPFRSFAYTHQVDCLTVSPDRFSEEWDIILDIPDWSPRAVIDEEITSILVFEREYELGLEASDGRDRICLRKYTFRDRPASENERMFNEHILGLKTYVPKNPERYTDERRYCICETKSILIAQEK
ncbi:MAG: hypothetical protein IJ042_00530 [Butyricicoccus sp.]|nr:hypothetical protein [Butyricicoccus sp.]